MKIDFSNAVSLTQENLEEPLDRRRQIHAVFREIEKQIQTALKMQYGDMNTHSEGAKTKPAYFLYKDLRGARNANCQFDPIQCKELSEFFVRGLGLMNAQALLSTAGVLSEVAGDKSYRKNCETHWLEELDSMRAYWSQQTPPEGGTYSVEQDEEDHWYATLRVQR